jgi:hypothetical protein
VHPFDRVLPFRRPCRRVSVLYAPVFILRIGAVGLDARHVFFALDQVGLARALRISRVRDLSPRHRDPGGECRRLADQVLVDDVNAAIDRLAQRHPEYFDLGDTAGPGEWRVLQVHAYLDGLVEELRTAGFCAETDRASMVSVKSSNDASEDYNVLLPTDHVSAATACTPRPAARPPFRSTPRTRSRTCACTSTPSTARTAWPRRATARTSCPWAAAAS